MAEESKLQSKILDYLQQEDGWMVNKLVSMSRNGWPDIVAIKNGKTIWIEVKAKGKKPEPLQENRMKWMAAQGAIVFWCDSFEMFYSEMNRLKL